MPTSIHKEQTLRVGLPKYLNTLPLLYYLKAPKGIKIILKTPKKINEDLEEEALDVGLASSLYYARNYTNLLLLPDLSISAVGTVHSVILLHQLPLQKLHQQKIGITPETETSFGLLRLVLEDFFKVFPHYEILASPLTNLKNFSPFSLSGYLAIGDEALMLKERGLFNFATDLAEIWLEKTKLPFVFALMVVRKKILTNTNKLLKRFLAALYLSRAKSLSSLEKLVSSNAFNMEKDYALQYLQHLEYDFSGLKQRSFLYFCELLYKKGILKNPPKLNFFEL